MVCGVQIRISADFEWQRLPTHWQPQNPSALDRHPSVVCNATPILQTQGEKNVIGWLIIFATATFTSGFWGSSAHEPGALLASGIFGALFLLALGAKAVRGPVC
jgi:hypothetical protein